MVLHQLERFLVEHQDIQMPAIRFLLNLQSQIQSVLKEVRYLSQNLRPSILEHLGLLPAIESLTEGLNKHQGVEAGFMVKGKAARFQPEIELSLFRIMQEALNNILRHAEATRVEVILEFKEDGVLLTVQDNGKGMQELPQSFYEFLKQGKLGLIGMSERVKLFGGKLQLASTPGNGTILTITLPPGCLLI
ncbi:ATPase [Desulforamulus profundi]|uniref:histidine kinase n=2 Tax=Desulforamulus profundi TaxID=1383067 RepID=A0A2C6MJ21_9FIRM|nr:ATPase [Desulforamulus profundi]